MLKANLSASWRHQGGFTAGFNVTWVGDFLECEQNDCNDGNLSRTVDAYRKVDVFTSFPVGGMTVAMGVNNVNDVPPPTIFIGFQGDSDAATYNYLGRFFWARITQRF
jgi:outer membrane receptor protein involved in Fe transport